MTVGSANGLFSFVREYFEDGTHATSMELAILPYGHEGGAFSVEGDSGAAIVDGKGRVAGLLAGAAGTTEFADVTYVTPFYWLLERIRVHVPNACLY